MSGNNGTTPEFKPKSWSAHPVDLEKEYNQWDKERTDTPEIPTKPEEFSKAMVRRGTLDPETGLSTGVSKQGKILDNNIKRSNKYKDNYEETFGHT